MRMTAKMSLLAVLAAGCVHTIDDEAPGRRVGTVLEDCVVSPPEAVAALGAPVSIEYPDRSLWIWTEVTLAGDDGGKVRNVAAFVDDAQRACDGDFRFLTEDATRPTPILALSEAEKTHNDMRSDGRRLELVPTGGFVHEGDAVIYYEKVLTGPELFESDVLGMGVCRLQSGSARCVRARPEGIRGEPTLLWDRRARMWNRGGFVADDGHAYLYGCLHAAAFETLCSIARVEPERAEDPGAYRYRGLDGWIEDPWNAVTAFRAPAAVTPSFNPHVDRYLVVTSNIWDDRIEARGADEPWGPHDNPVVLFETTSPKDWFIDGGREHPGLRRDGGRELVITYHTGVEGEAEGLHVVRFGLERSLYWD